MKKLLCAALAAVLLLSFAACKNGEESVLSGDDGYTVGSTKTQAQGGQEEQDVSEDEEEDETGTTDTAGTTKTQKTKKTKQTMM